MVARFAKDGFAVFARDENLLAWANTAHAASLKVVKTPWDLRHGRTWRVGHDELPNDADGSIAGLPLRG